jgi:hypothetical protein
MPTELRRQKLTKEERYERAIRWPILWYFFYRRLWKVRYECSPPLSFFECVKLARLHVHSYVWNYTAIDVIVLPRKRVRVDSR